VYDFSSMIFEPNRTSNSGLPGYDRDRIADSAAQCGHPLSWLRIFSWFPIISNDIADLEVVLSRFVYPSKPIAVLPIPTRRASFVVAPYFDAKR
jgi:hypothetical protein